MSGNEASVPCDIKDLALAESGKRQIEWASQAMPVLASIRKQFIKTQAFAGIHVSASLPVTAEAANLIITLRDGGAKIAVCGVDGRSAQDDVAASLVKDYAVPVYALSGVDEDTNLSFCGRVLDPSPDLLLDQAGVLSCRLAGEDEPRKPAIGAAIQTREGARKLRSLAREGRLGFPVLSGSSSLTRRVFHSRIGGGQSTLDILVSALNVMLAGLNVVVAGYGGIGRGIAARAKGLGACVIVTEVDPIRALEALVEGYRVLCMADAAALGDVFITVSGGRNVIGREHFDKFRNGAILLNGGHSDAEIDLGTLSQIVSSRRQVRPQVEEVVMRDGRRVHLVAGGRSDPRWLG